MRSLLWPWLPFIPIAIYGAIENVSTARLLLIALPIVFFGHLVLRRYYLRRFLSVFRNEVLAQMPSNIPIKK